MRTSGEQDGLVACGKLDVKPSNQGVDKVDSPNIQDIRGLECEIRGCNGVKIDGKYSRRVGHTGFDFYRVH